VNGSPSQAYVHRYSLEKKIGANRDPCEVIEKLRHGGTVQAVGDAAKDTYIHSGKTDRQDREGCIVRCMKVMV